MQSSATLSLSDEISYPKREPRYNRLGWNSKHQDCYSEEDQSLLSKIGDLYHRIIGDDRSKQYFSLSESTQWREWWTCSKPTTSTSEATTSSDSYTLPNREAKDSHIHPLANFAEHMARKIANWQSDRVQGQQPELMNDPVMLVLSELRDWFFTDLAEKECTLNVLPDLAKRQSYIKSLIHLIPHFGPDRKHLHEIQQSLDQAANILRTCVANKALPQLLSDLIISGKNMEATLGTYLHFLLIDEPVADNFSPDNLESKDPKCIRSPICKIYQRSELPKEQAGEITALSSTKSSRFYSIQKVSDTTIDTPATMQAKMTLRADLLDPIKFASFVTSNDKMSYLEALAAIDALIEVRKTLEKFNQIQTSLGTYAFAINYLEQADKLANYYIRIIERTKARINNLLKIAEDGHGVLLNRDVADKRDVHFEKNLKSLETRFAKGTTVRTQLSNYCEKTIASMNKYQDEIKKLAASVRSGEATQEVEAAMRDLYKQMHYLNTMLPAILGEPYVTVTTPQELTAITTDNPPKHEPVKETSSSPIQSTASPPPDATSLNPVTVETEGMIKWDILTDHATGLPVFNLEITTHTASTSIIQFHGKLIESKPDAQTGLSIFTYLYGDHDNQLGIVEFYGAPYFCVNADKSQHNIIKTTGVFSGFVLDKNRLLAEKEICPFTIPTFSSKFISSVGNAALHGFLRGGSTVLSEHLTEKPGWRRGLIAKFTYMGCLFTVNLANELIKNGLDNPNPLESFLSSLVHAVTETAQYALISFGIMSLTDILSAAGKYLTNHEYTVAGKTVQGASTITKYGFFAYNTLAGADISTPVNAAKTMSIAAGSIVAGAVVEHSTETVLKSKR